MKKQNLFLVVGLFLLFVLPLTLSFVSALDSEAVKSNWFVSPFVEALQSIGWTTYNTSVVLLGILLWIVIYSIIRQIFSFNTIWGSINAGHIGSAAVSLIIVILAFITIPANFIDTIILQYGAMGAAILSLIPLVIMLYFSIFISKSYFLSRMLWAFYIMYYFTLYIYRIYSLNIGFFTSESLPYLGAIVVGIVMLFSLKGLRKVVAKGQMESDKELALEDVYLRKTLRDVETADAKARNLKSRGNK